MKQMNSRSTFFLAIMPNSYFVKECMQVSTQTGREKKGKFVAVLYMYSHRDQPVRRDWSIQRAAFQWLAHKNLKLFGSLKIFSLIKGLGVRKLLNKRFCRIIHSHDFEEITDNFLVFTSLFPPSPNPKTYNYIQESRFLCLY